jgi:acyl-CoA synthetase (NDP forming)
MNDPIARFLNPRTIAVFGGAQAGQAIVECDRMGFDGEIWPVHPSKDEILGRPVYRSVQELPGSPDAAYVGVNRTLTVDVVRGLADRGAGGAVCFATGFAEEGDQGAELARELLDASGEMPLLGPNTYGYLNYLTGAALWPDQQGGRLVDRGVGIITMSSNVGFNLTMQRRGLPIAFMVSLGNRLKFDLHDAIRALAGEERVTALGLYLETMPDPRAFQAAVDVAREMSKPVVALKTGRSDVAQKMVVSHTASLAGSDELVSALFERAGVARVGSLEALIEALKVLHVLGPLGGGRVGAMSTSGGDLTLLADAMGPDLSLPRLSEHAARRLTETVHERVVAANPLDYQMFTWDDEEANAANFTALLSEGFDVALCLLDYPREDLCDQSTWGGAERGFVRAVKQTGTKGAVLATFADTVSESVAVRLMEDGVAMLAGIDAGVAGVQAAVDVGAAWGRAPGPPLLLPRDASSDPVAVLDEAASKRLLARAGVPVPDSRVVVGADDAAAAARVLGFPVAVKALGIAHKTEVGGLRLNLRGAVEVSAAVAEMSDLSDAFLVERMVEGAVAELIVGVARDEQFGPYLVVGGGGILVELTKDSASLLLPTARDDVLRALDRLRCAPLLHGFRGAAPADVDAVADVVLAIAGMVERDPASIAELDVNPLLVLAQGRGAVAADALVRIHKAAGDATAAGVGDEDA